MSYHSDQGRMEREYYTPRELPEGEYEDTVTVYCGYDQCSEFEVEHEETLLVVYVGDTGSVTYTCLRCGLESNHEVSVADSNTYDTDEDWRSDK